MKNNLGKAKRALVLAAAAILPTSSLAVGDLVSSRLTGDLGASERVEAAGLLQVLSQEMASAACHLQYGIDIERSRELLEETKLKFNYILDALEHGSEELNIVGAEERRKTIIMIQELRTTWTPLHKAGLRLLDTPDDQDALLLIKAENEEVLTKSELLLSELASQYSNPFELLQSDVLLLEFVARQAMFTQKMAKISCEIWAGNNAEDRIELLSKIMNTYELTLGALLNGMPTAGLNEAPTPEIKASLTEATETWGTIKSHLQDVMTSVTDTSDEIRSTLYAELTKEMYRMEALEKKYVEFSKHQYE